MKIYMQLLYMQKQVDTSKNQASMQLTVLFQINGQYMTTNLIAG